MLLKWVNRWIEKLENSQRKDVHLRRDFLNKLQRNFNDEKILAMELEAEAEHLPYDHLREEVLQLAKREHEHAEQLVKLMEDLDGQVDRSVESQYQAKADGEFSELLRVENELGERLREESNWAEDYGLFHHAKVLREIDEEHHEHMEKIEKIIMRVNSTV